MASRSNHHQQQNPNLASNNFASLSFVPGPSWLEARYIPTTTTTSTSNMMNHDDDPLDDAEIQRLEHRPYYNSSSQQPHVPPYDYNRSSNNSVSMPPPFLRRPHSSPAFPNDPTMQQLQQQQSFYPPSVPLRISTASSSSPSSSQQQGYRPSRVRSGGVGTEVTSPQQPHQLQHQQQQHQHSMRRPQSMDALGYMEMGHNVGAAATKIVEDRDYNDFEKDALDFLADAFSLPRDAASTSSSHGSKSTHQSRSSRPTTSTTRRSLSPTSTSSSSGRSFTPCTLEEELTSGILQSCGALSVSLGRLKSRHCRSLGILKPMVDPDALLLQALFADFCTPPPSLDSIAKLYELETMHWEHFCSNSGEQVQDATITPSTSFDEANNNNKTPPRNGATATTAGMMTPPASIGGASSNHNGYNSIPLTTGGGSFRWPQSMEPEESISLYKDCLVHVRRSSVISLLSSHEAFLRLHRPFQLTFLRILIRLLTSETDHEYHRECLWTLDWWESELRELLPTTVAATTTFGFPISPYRSSGGLSGKDNASSSSLSSVNSPERSTTLSAAELRARTQMRIEKVRNQRKTLLEKRRRDGSTRSSTKSRHKDRDPSVSRTNQLLYTMVRFRNGWDDSTSTTDNSSNEGGGERQQSSMEALLTLFEQLLLSASSSSISTSTLPLLAPVARLLGLLGTAGLSVRELRHFLTIASSTELKLGTSLSPVKIPPLARLLLIRALTTATEGASKSSLLVGKASPRHFFSFSCGPGLGRTMTNVSNWPFRNDFGMAVWFRAETFDLTSKLGANHEILYPTLLSVRSDDGAGIEISLIPEPTSSSSATSAAAVLAITVFDSPPSPHWGNDTPQSPIGRTMKVGGCVLLPRVWYHLAVRHTRSRLKGVFSLSTRQQVTIMLDGKVILTEALKFPHVADIDARGPSPPPSLLPKGISQLTHKPVVSSNPSSGPVYQMTVKFGSNFEGQTGALYLFQDNVADATFRDLFEFTAGSTGVLKKESSHGNVWDSRRGEIAKKSNVLGINMTKDDVDEIVLGQRSFSSSMQSSGAADNASAVIDLGENDDHEDQGVPSNLLKSAFGSKLFLVWDPRRMEGQIAIELHRGEHASAPLGNVHPWCVESAKDAIGSVGGVQLLMTLYHSLLFEDIYQDTLSSNDKITAIGIDSFERAQMFTTVPELFYLTAAFLRGHNENAREMLRCGGIDVIENLLTINKKIGRIESKHPTSGLIGGLHVFWGLSDMLIDSLMNFRSACSHYVGLETKVFSRLFFNLPLWFGESRKSCGVALHATLLPLLSSVARASPEKVRDCVGVQDMILLLREYINGGSTTSDDSYSEEAVTGLFDRSVASDLKWNTRLTVMERHHIVDIIIGIIYGVVSVGTFVEQISPFLNFISHNLDIEWESASQHIKEGQSPDLSEMSKTIRHRTTLKACAALLFLLQTRPTVPGLFESFASCCGGVQGGASWILCAIVNSFSDDIRGLGIRCLGAYLDITAASGNAILCLPGKVTESAVALTKDEAPKNTLLPRRLSAIALGLSSATQPGKITAPTKLTARVVFKLLWHLLKCHRSRIGKRTHAALLYLVLDDGGILSSSLSSFEFVTDHFVVPDETCRSGFRINMNWADAILTQTSLTAGKTLRDSSIALPMVLRILRFLPSKLKDEWLQLLLSLIRNNQSSARVLSHCIDWQPCLFHLLSETVEELRALEVNEARPETVRAGSLSTSEKDDLVTLTNQTFEHSTMDELCPRFDVAFKLYANLLGHRVRVGGDKALLAIEEAAALQRVCVNGNEVFAVLLNYVLADLLEHGALDIEYPVSTTGISSDSISPLKYGAKLVTEALLSNGTEGMDMQSALLHWRSLRHLTAIVVAIVTRSGFGAAELFDYRNPQASAVDKVTGGLNGIRLGDANHQCISAAEYVTFVAAAGHNDREISRRVCVAIGYQVLSLLDAFIFPESLDASLPASQLHGLALVRSTEPRLGNAQGPLIASAVRISLLLLGHLEPCGVKLLQCCSRLRCFLHWALELIRESVALAGYSAVFDELTAPLDRLVLAIVLQSHRALGRCAALLSEIENNSYDRYFQNVDSRRKNQRRILRVAFELREIVLTVYRGRKEILRACLSPVAFDCLQRGFERLVPARQPGSKPPSKEAVIRAFLSNGWVSSFQDVETLGALALPEQIAAVDRGSARLGIRAVEGLSRESAGINDDFEHAINPSFESYLEGQRQWTETDAVRDLEYEGDTCVKKLSGKHRNDVNEVSRFLALRDASADLRWATIKTKVGDLWEPWPHWMLAKYTDRLHRRILLVQNRCFDDHNEASYESMLGKEREKAIMRQKDKDLKDVMRRNKDAFEPFRNPDESDFEEGEGVAGTEGALDSVEIPDEAVDGGTTGESSNLADGDWAVVDNDESSLLDTDLDGWAKAFIWSDGESVVARFENVMVVSLRSVIEGRLLLTTHGLYFHPTGQELNVMTKEAIQNSDLDSAERDRRWRLSRLTEVHGRRYLLRAQALELFFSDSYELFLNFLGGLKERDRFHSKLRSGCKVPMLWSPKSLNHRTVFKKSRLADLWKKRRISNFQYIMALNKMAGRTFNDIAQYPVFPWVISDFTSETIDLNDPSIYRDLSKPIGALNDARLAQLVDRYKDLVQFGFLEKERFLYGSHYSSPGVVLHYLIRQEPFTTMAIELQSGRFDCPDRLFLDVEGCWKSCLTSTSDFKELVPEFFTCPEIFLNTNNFPLGHTQDGRKVDDVGLPPWAKGSAHEFVRIHRLALESEHVSQNLNQWIDLVFGFKQRGPEAEAAHNVFHYLSYEGSVDVDQIKDEIDRQATESHIQNFGQTPSQLLTKEPHPRRCPVQECWQPLIHNISVAKHLRCFTPAKQFNSLKNGQNHGAVVKIQVFTDSIVAVYADWSVGLYKWTPRPNGKSKFQPDKLINLPGRELTTSRYAIRRGLAAPQSMDSKVSKYSIGNWSVALTLGGYTKEQLRRKMLQPSRLTRSNSKDGTTAAEAAALLVTCGYWDYSIKIHSTDDWQMQCSETGGHQGPIRCLAIAADGALMITGGQDATCRIWVVDHPDMAVALSDGYVQTALGGFNSTKSDGDKLLRCCRVLWGHEAPVTCVDLSSDLDVAVGGSTDGVICVHGIRQGNFIRSFRPGPLVMTGDQRQQQQQQQQARNYEVAARKIVLDSNGMMVIHMDDGGLHTYTINGVKLCSAGAGEKLHDMQLCSNGEILVTGGDRCQVVIRTVMDLRIRSSLDVSRHGPIRCIAFTPEDLNPIPQFLFVGSDDGMITIVDQDPTSDDTETLTFWSSDPK